MPSCPLSVSCCSKARRGVPAIHSCTMEPPATMLSPLWWTVSPQTVSPNESFLPEQASCRLFDPNNEESNYFNTQMEIPSFKHLLKQIKLPKEGNDSLLSSNYVNGTESNCPFKISAFYSVSLYSYPKYKCINLQFPTSKCCSIETLLFSHCFQWNIDEGSR